MLTTASVLARRMPFRPNQTLILPELAAHAGLASAEFRVLEILAGGMGECVRVVQARESFALKVIRGDLVENADSWSRYLREARIWMTLSACDSVVEAFCKTRINEIPVVCSRWMTGGNLRRYLKNRSPEFFFRVIGRVVGTLAWALEHHHIIHRDIKPDNILLDQAGLAFVSDWGLARQLTVKPSLSRENVPRQFTGVAQPELTLAGSVLGTVCYASPEQLMGEDNIDHRTDIYSLACLMFEWEVGSPPFTGANAEEIYSKHLLQAPARLGSLLRKTTFGAEDVIGECLAKDPGRRPPDYASIELALERAASRRGVRYERFRPEVLYKIPMVGAGKYDDFVRSRKTSIGQDGGTYFLAERSDIVPFLREADALSALGDYGKAAHIYGSAFVPGMVSAAPNYRHNQLVTVGYAFCLSKLGRNKEAVEVLNCLADATEKPAEYFVNLSLARIKQAQYRAAAATAAEGLQIYPDDPDLVGNLLVAQSALGAFVEAAETAKKRLIQLRDVHSLHEVAGLHCMYADSVRETDWPLAVKNYKFAVGLLQEAKGLNPRYLPVRLQLLTALEAVTAYAKCTSEAGSVRDLPWQVSDRIFVAYLIARCLDRVNAHKECWEFCDGWLNGTREWLAKNPSARHNVTKLERVRAVAIADGFCIGMMSDGKRVIAPTAAEFFAHIVRDKASRHAVDFCYLARLHEWMEENEEAEAVLSEAESLYPTYWEIPFQRADFCQRAGDFRQATDPAERATQLAPWMPQAWQLLADIHRNMGRLTQADSAASRSEEVRRLRSQLTEEIEAI